MIFGGHRLKIKDFCTDLEQCVRVPTQHRYLFTKIIGTAPLLTCRVNGL